MKIPLFDIDGTLFKASYKFHGNAFDHAFKNVYRANALESEINGQGMTDRQIIHTVLNLHGFSRQQVEERIDDAQSAMAAHFFENTKAITLIPLEGVIELLKELRKRKIPIGLLTGNTEKIAWRKLELAGITDYFDFGAFGGVTDKRVELVEIARKQAANKLNKKFSKKQFVIVGDTPKDIQCAKDANILVIAVASGTYSFEELKKESPDLLVHTLEEKEKIINFLLK